MKPLLLAIHAGLLGIAALNLAYLRLSAGRRTRPAPLPRVSILVPARDEEHTLPRLLESLVTQQYAGGFEIVVVDDASTDGTAGILESYTSRGLRAIASSGPPAGWVGKNHALHTAAGAATGDVFLFLDADTWLLDSDALGRLVERHADLGEGAVLSGLTRFADRGATLLLTGLVPFAVMSSLPLPLVRGTRSPALSALNGQAWMVSAETYRRLEPHQAMRDRVLEDVEIGRLFKRAGVPVSLRDLADEVAVEMYRSLPEAWRGFRKNAYLLQGGRPAPFLASFLAYVALFVVGPRIDKRILGTTLLLKAVTDRGGRLPIYAMPMATISLLAGACLQVASAHAHWTGRAQWKGRRV